MIELLDLVWNESDFTDEESEDFIFQYGLDGSECAYYVGQLEDAKVFLINDPCRVTKMLFYVQRPSATPVFTHTNILNLLEHFIPGVIIDTPQGQTVKTLLDIRSERRDQTIAA